MPALRTPRVRLLAEFAFTVVTIVAGCAVLAGLGWPRGLMFRCWQIAPPKAGRPIQLDLPLAAMPNRQPPKRWLRGQQMLSRRDYRTIGAVLS